MDTSLQENNQIVLVGKITTEKTFSHEVYGETFYIFNIEVPRLSGASDSVPVTISERLINKEELEVGKKVSINGQFRSYNTIVNDRSKLILTVFVKDITIEEYTEATEAEISKSNEVILNGYVCKKPIYRKTPFGREIADVLLAVNRTYSKSDYIPCIAWGRNARFCENIETGKQMRILGRVQSRTYEKKNEDGTVTPKTAYEVSICGMEIIEENDTENENKDSVEEAI